MDDRVLLSLVLLCARRKMRRKNRSVWVNKLLKRKREESAYDNLMNELAVEDTESYRRFIKMDVAAFEDILQKTERLISKQDTSMRCATPAAEKLAITLRFLAIGETYKSLSCRFGIGRTTIGGFIPEVCNAIFTALSCEYMKIPNTTAEWESIASRFEEQWNFPLCIGALGAKQIIIQPTGNNITEVYNKGSSGVLVLALIDADYQFIFVGTSKNSGACVSTMWAESLMQKGLDDKTLGIPNRLSLMPGEKPVPHVVVADSVFTLREHLLVPYPEHEITDQQRVFNYRLSRAQRVSENAFGILGWRWKIFNASLRVDTSNLQSIIMATCVLHNYLLKQTGTCQLYSPMTAVDQEYTITGEMAAGDWRAEHQIAVLPVRSVPWNSTTDATDVRDRFTSYFCGHGEVEWQWRLINVSD